MVNLKGGFFRRLATILAFESVTFQNRKPHPLRNAHIRPPGKQKAHAERLACGKAIGSSLPARSA
jgi:hypothetical protein